MVAKMNYDKGVSVLEASQFNYGGQSVNFITDDMAREVMDFSIEKRPLHDRRRSGDSPHELPSPLRWWNN